MIITVTLNPSIDKSGVIPGIVYDDVLRIRDISGMAGGKGVNVSRVLCNFSVRNTALGFAGGGPGKDFLRMIREEGIRHSFVPIRGATRTNWTLLDEKEGKILKLNEPGPLISGREAGQFLQVMKRYVNKNAVFVVTGSLPGGLKADYYEKIMAILSGRVSAVFWDSETVPKMKDAKPDFMKPNIHEAQRLLKTTIKNDRDMIKALKALKRYTRYPFISASEKGLYFEDNGKVICFQTPRLEHYSIPGAGDSFTAGFCAGWARKLPLFDSAKLGVACAASTVENARFACPEDAKKMLGRIKTVRL